MIDTVGLAEELIEAQRSRVPVPFLTSRFPNLDWDTARQVARATDQIRLDAGDVQIGWKLDWTSEAMRTALGIDRPNWGTLWQSQIVINEAKLDRFLQPKLEPELVWKAGADLAGQDVIPSEVDEAGGEWAVGIEVVDPRFPSFDFEALDNTADNTSCAAVAVGAFGRLQPSGLLDSLRVTFANDQDERTGLGSQAMGSPAAAVAWLIRSLSEEGLSVTAGEIVFTGGITAPFDAARGCNYRASAEPLSRVNLRIV